MDLGEHAIDRRLVRQVLQKVAGEDRVDAAIGEEIQMIGIAGVELDLGRQVSRGAGVKI